MKNKKDRKEVDYKPQSLTDLESKFQFLEHFLLLTKVMQSLFICIPLQVTWNSFQSLQKGSVSLMYLMSTNVSNNQNDVSLRGIVYSQVLPQCTNITRTRMTTTKKRSCTRYQFQWSPQTKYTSTTTVQMRIIQSLGRALSCKEGVNR